MGRGIIESGLFRSERYQLGERTTDPASTSEGEMWIRTDLAPETDQLATLRVDAGGSTWDVPIYDTAATTKNVEKAWRVQVGGATGFVPITDDYPTYSALKYQHNGTAFGVHDALTASAIPDSGVSKYEFESGSGSTAVDSWGSNDGTINGATYSTDSAVGTYALNFDGANGYVDLGNPSSLEITDSTSVVGRFKTSVDASSTVSVIRHDGSFTPLQIRNNGQARAVVFIGGSDYYTFFNWSYGDGAYHSYAATFGSNGTTVYVDGSQVASNTTTGTLDTTTNPWQLGRSELGDEYYNGLLDDVRFYNKELTGIEVSNWDSTGSISG